MVREQPAAIAELVEAARHRGHRIIQQTRCQLARGALIQVLRDDAADRLRRRQDLYRPRLLADEVVRIDLNRPMAEILKTLSGYPIRTRLSLTGPLIVARDLAILRTMSLPIATPEALREHSPRCIDMRISLRKEVSN